MRPGGVYVFNVEMLGDSKLRNAYKEKVCGASEAEVPIFFGYWDVSLFLESAVITGASI